MLRSIYQHVLLEKAKPDSENRLSGGGKKNLFKLENLARFYLSTESLSNHESSFQLAFMDPEVFDKLNLVMTMWDQKKLKDQTEPKAKKRKQTATEKGKEFLAKPLLTVSHLKELPSIDKDDQLAMLQKVIDGHYSLNDMSKAISRLKEINDVKLCFAKVLLKKDWLSVDAKYRARISDVDLEQHRLSITAYMKKLRSRSKVIVSDADRDLPIEFVSFVRANTRADLYTKGSTSHSWTEMTKEKVLSRYEQVQTFEGGKFPNQALPDGTKVCSSMKYKIINANSCDRTWVEKRQTWSEAQESFSELQKAYGILEMATMEKKPALVTVGIGGNLVTEETVWSWVDQEEIRKVEDDDSVLQGNVYIYSSLTFIN